MIFRNASVFYQGTFQNLDVQIKEDRIVMVKKVITDQDDEETDCFGKQLLPGLVEIHSHGCMGYDFSTASVEEMEIMRAFYLSLGITSIAATIMTMGTKELKKAAQIIKKAIQMDSKGNRIVGINMEGPFLEASKKGAHDEKYLIPIDSKLFDELDALSGNNIKLVDIDPDLKGAMEFIKKYSKDKTISLAHTGCNYDTAMKAFDLGATHITHLFNAMNGLHHREPGIIGALSDRDVHAEIICDGIHIHPSVIRLMFHLCPEKMIIVSDSMSASGLEDGEYVLGGLPVHVENKKATLADGTIAGSTTNLYESMVNAIRFGATKEKAILSASLIPAKALNLQKEIGSIEVGKKADMILTDTYFRIEQVYLSGKRVK
jgi:N-acetylglucosamine-6-phosphate deacetylase